MGMLIAVGKIEDVLEDAPNLIENLARHHGEESIQAAQAMAVFGKALLLNGQSDRAEEQLAKAAQRYEQKGATGLRIYRSIRADLEKVRRENAEEDRARSPLDGR